MLATLEALERRLYWRPRPGQPLQDRIFHIADGLLSLIELERFAASRPGPLPRRIAYLASAILAEAEGRYGITSSGKIIPERVKEVRRRIIQQQQNVAVPTTDEIKRQWAADMDDMFRVTQLYSYPGDYLIANPSWERLAETLDKLEEDALGANYPTIRGRTAAKVCFDQPIELPRGKQKDLSAAELTDQIEVRVQGMLATATRHREVPGESVS